MWMRRTLASDHTLSGFGLRAGDKVLLYCNSTNRDVNVDVFENPFTFDIARSPNDHFGPGAPGPHSCLGVHLARREITVMFRKLLARTPAIDATDEPSQLISNFVNGIKPLPYNF